MQIVVLLLLVLALALLVFGLISGSTPLVVASIVASLLAAYAMVRYQRRRETAATRPEAVVRPEPVAGEARRPVVAKPPVASKPPVAAQLPVPAGSSVVTAVPEMAETEASSVDGAPDRESSYEDEPAAAQTEPPLHTHRSEPVWVIDGRPRYHLSSCIFIIGRRPEPVSLKQAVEDGFSPCAQCDPDTALVAG